MRKLIIAFIILLSPLTAFGAVGFGAIGTVNTNSSYTSPSTSGTNTVGLVYVAGETTGDDITATTWGGVSMTKVAVVQTPITDRYTSLWCVNNPASASTIAFTGSTFWRSIAMYYTGTQCPVDSSNTNTSTASASLTISTTVVASNSWTVMFQKDGAGGKSYTTDVGVIRLDADAGGLEVSDSNGTVGTGSQSTTQTQTVGTTNHGGIAISLAPYVAPPTDTFNPWQFFSF